MKLPWKPFIKAIGTDLLPVVVDPKIEPHPDSSLRELGKVPSVVTEGGARGIAGWSTKAATPAELAQWSADPRLGFGMRAATLKAITIDAPTVVYFTRERDRILKALRGVPTLHAQRRARRKSGIILFASNEDQRKAVTTSTMELDFFGSSNFVMLSDYSWPSGVEARLQELVKSKKRVTAEQLAKIFP